MLCPPFLPLWSNDRKDAEAANKEGSGSSRLLSIFADRRQVHAWSAGNEFCSCCHNSLAAVRFNERLHVLLTTRKE